MTPMFFAAQQGRTSASISGERMEYGGWFEGYIPGSPREALGDRAYIKGAVDGPELSSYHMTSMFYDLWRVSDPKYKTESSR